MQGNVYTGESTVICATVINQLWASLFYKFKKINLQTIYLLFIDNCARGGLKNAEKLKAVEFNFLSHGILIFEKSVKNIILCPGLKSAELTFSSIP